MVCIGICNYHISANSFRGNYSFFNWALCTVVTFGDSKYIKVGKLFKGGNYLQKYGIHQYFTVWCQLIGASCHFERLADVEFGDKFEYLFTFCILPCQKKNEFLCKL